MSEESTIQADSPTREFEPRQEKVPGIALAAAGLAVFDILLAIAYVSIWLWDRRAALLLIQTLSGVAILLGLGAIAAGGLVFNRNRRMEGSMPGAVWARAGIAAGLSLLAVTVMLPLISALTVLVGSEH